jgi:hypothetical protein
MHLFCKGIIAYCLYSSDAGRTVGAEEDRKYFSNEVVELLAFVDRTDCAIGTTLTIVFNVASPYFAPFRFIIRFASGTFSFHKFTAGTAI